MEDSQTKSSKTPSQKAVGKSSKAKKEKDTLSVPNENSRDFSDARQDALSQTQDQESQDEGKMARSQKSI